MANEYTLETLQIEFTSNAADVEKGINGLNNTLSKLGNIGNKVSSSSDKVNKSLSGVFGNTAKLKRVLNRVLKFSSDAFTASNDYVEGLNLFTVSMGKAADAAKNYAQEVQNLIGIDMSEWMNYQGTFQNLVTGFDISSDKADIMSQNLTQLSYDLSSFFNTSAEKAFDKLSSAMAGQVKGLREFGINTTVASLGEYALSKGITLSVNKMTQAQKTMLRYNYIMEKSINMQGDMARTIVTPANALRIVNAQFQIFKRTLGNVVSVGVTQFIPYFQAMIQLLTEAAQALANLFGYTLPEIDYSSLESGGSYAEDLSDDLDDATSSAKKLQKAILGMDEINKLDDNKDSGSAAGAGGGLGSDLGLEPISYDFLKGLEQTDLEPFKEKLKEILEQAVLIGSAIAAWKLSKKLLEGVEYLQKIKPQNFSWSFSILGASLFLADLDRLKKYIEDMNENGLNFTNITGAFSEFAGLMGDCLLMMGKLKYAGALKAVQGIGEIVSGISDICKNGVDIDNVTTIVRGLSNLAIAVGLFTGNIKLAGAATAIQGFTTIIGEIGENWDAIKQGDWSGVDKVTLVIGAIEVLGGVLTALGVFSKLKKATDVSETTTALQEVSTATEQVSTTTSTLTSKLTDLVKNLALGIVVLTEVAVAAGIVVGAVWGLGLLLEQVGIAWQPVIDNAGTVAIAMGIGVVLLAAIGAVTALLGSVGTSLIVNLALGIAMLALLGVSAGLFIAEIWAIGWGLEQIGIAWQPVLDNGETIATAIGIGTGLLVAIGVVCALLGVAAVASAGLLPLAIGLGTAMLLELGAATLLFIAEIWAIGKGLDEVGKAWQPVLDNGDTIEQGIAKGTELLIAIGVVTAALGVASVASVGLLPLAIGLGTALLVDLGDAVVEFNNSLVKVAKSLSNKLQPALRELNGKLPSLSKDMDDFTRFMKFFAGQVVDYSKSSAISGFAATVDAIIKFFTKDPIKAMADDAHNQYKQAINLNEKLRLANPELETAIRLITRYYDFLEQLEKLTEKTNNISLANGMFVSMKEVGKNLVTGFVDGIKSENSSLSKAVKSVLGDAFSSRIAKDYGYDFGKSLGSGIASGFKNSSFPTLKGTVDVTNGGSVSLKLRAYAAGGFPDAGQMFIAREAGPEMVGSIGNRTAVANNDQIVSGISEGVADANGEQNSLLREQNALLRKILEKDTTVNAVVSTNNVIEGLQRKNRRDGKTIVPVGV